MIPRSRRAFTRDRRDSDSAHLHTHLKQRAATGRLLAGRRSCYCKALSDPHKRRFGRSLKAPLRSALLRSAPLQPGTLDRKWNFVVKDKTSAAFSPHVESITPSLVQVLGSRVDSDESTCTEALAKLLKSLVVCRRWSSKHLTKKIRTTLFWGREHNRISPQAINTRLRGFTTLGLLGSSCDLISSRLP